MYFWITSCKDHSFSFHQFIGHSSIDSSPPKLCLQIHLGPQSPEMLWFVPLLEAGRHPHTSTPLSHNELPRSPQEREPCPPTACTPPWASPVMTPSITATLSGWAPQARPRRGGNAAHSSVELLMITSSGKPFISLLSGQNK